MHFVDLAGGEALPKDGHSTANANVLSFGRLFRFLESRLQPIGHEVKRVAAFHLERSPRVMREHKNRSVKRRIIAPPPLPRIVFPRASNWPKHIPAHNPGANIFETFRGHIVVNSRAPAALTVHLPEYLGGEKPCVHF